LKSTAAADDDDDDDDDDDEDEDEDDDDEDDEDDDGGAAEHKRGDNEEGALSERSEATTCAVTESVLDNGGLRRRNGTRLVNLDVLSHERPTAVALAPAPRCTERVRWELVSMAAAAGSRDCAQLSELRLDTPPSLRLLPSKQAPSAEAAESHGSCPPRPCTTSSWLKSCKMLSRSWVQYQKF
jgi:hypothetical protein